MYRQPPPPPPPAAAPAPHPPPPPPLPAPVPAPAAHSRPPSPHDAARAMFAARVGHDVPVHVVPGIDPDNPVFTATVQLPSMPTNDAATTAARAAPAAR